MIHALLLGAMAFLPVHGRYPIGRTKFDWVDAARNEPSAAGHKRELVVYVWYPSEARAECTPAPYLPDAALMSDALPKEVAGSVAAAKTGACLDAPLSRAQERFPVIVFSPGDGFKTLGYSALQEDLASRGYIVAAIDVPYNAPVVELSDGRVTRPREEEPPPPNLSPDALKQYAYDQTMAQLQLWAEDIAFVARRMGELDRNDRRFRGRIDTKAIGSLGHSAGGLASFHACQIDPALRACADIDGNYRARPYPIAAAAESPSQPFLWIHIPQPAFTDQQLEQRKMSRTDYERELALGKAIMAGVASGSYDVTFTEPGVDHLDFTDFRLFESGIAPKTLTFRRQTLEQTRAVLAAFFDEALRGIRTPVAAAPGVNVVHYAGSREAQ
jgi:predicted dienelactone hydrolase